MMWEFGRKSDLFVAQKRVYYHYVCLSTTFLYENFQAQFINSRNLLSMVVYSIYIFSNVNVSHHSISLNIYYFRAKDRQVILLFPGLESFM